ncbi:MAG: hypothetical protein HGA98_02895 [Deltaproteobacteria bacterium]|nr:hypothetical protein [Deltaproteobacteria bacterium]
MVTSRSDGGSAQGVPVELVRELLQSIGTPLIAAQGFLSLLGRAPSEDCAQRYQEGLRASLEDMSERVERARVVFASAKKQ